MERLECGQPFSVFVDAAATPESLTLAMKAVRQVTRGRLIVVHGSAARLLPARQAIVGRVLERGAHAAVLTSGNFEAAAPLAEMHEMLDGFERPHKPQIAPSRATAIRLGLSMAQAGDAVLITGRGEQPSLVADDNASEVTDRDVACQWLYEPAQPTTPRPRFRVVG
jgi:UDP-N-acetylmuramoyl-L-alanyl-D-glutamate--2,6-diaminopimelate ligase